MSLQPRNKPTNAARRRAMRAGAVAAIFVVHAGLLAYLAARHSPTIHELAHLPAGICHWQFGMFELYRVNPPLPRMVAALPVLFCHPKTDWGNYQLDPLSRETIPMGIRFAKANGERTLTLFMVARWACIPFCLLGAWVCWRWAGELWGPVAGLLALCLWCFNPMILGHGALVMPDVAAAATGAFAAWRFWGWLREPTWSAAAQAGVALGLAELSKTTLLAFLPLWSAAWLIKASGAHQRAGSVRDRPREALQLAAILVLCVYLINLGYAFRGSCQPLGDYRFQSRLLSGKPIADPPTIGNRFSGGWLARLPLPLPGDYVQGIDCQRTDFEVGDHSYLHGRWKPSGWWYYYLVGLGIKTPLGTLAATLALAALSVGSALRVNPRRQGWLSNASLGAAVPDGFGRASCSTADELFLLAPCIAVLALVSSQTGFSNHVRYSIPALPYMFIWCSKLAAAPHGDARRRIARATAAWLCMTASAIESMIVYPHSISFFNVLVGGPTHGHDWLLDSNLAWGQDLIFLREWAIRHPGARPLHLATVGWLDPQALGIDYTLPPVGPSRAETAADRMRFATGKRKRAVNAVKAARGMAVPTECDESDLPQSWRDVSSLNDLGPQPGWYAIDVNFLHGSHWPATRRGWSLQKIAEHGLNYEYFRFFEPCHRIGYSYLIYHVTREEAEKLRNKLGMPPLR